MTNYRVGMRVYHERLRVPGYWWPLGLLLVALLGAELVTGFRWQVAAAGYGVLVAACLAALLLSGHAAVEVREGELVAGRWRLPLGCAGEVTALDEDQTRQLRGPRADPRAFVLTRPYLRRAVYIEITREPGPAAGSGLARRARLRAPLPRRAAASPGGPYWLLGSRHPAELAAAIEESRPAARAEGLAVG